MAAHNGMLRMSFIERTAPVFNVRAEKFCSQLVFQLFDPGFIGVPKEKPNHSIRKDAIDEIVDDGSELVFSAQRLKQIFWGRFVHT
jgi:hypothetical protein